MKKLLCALFLVGSCFLVFGQSKYKPSDKVTRGDLKYVSVLGMEYDSRSSFSVKGGITRIRIVDTSDDRGLEARYQQFYAKYNTIENAIGLQASYGFSFIFGVRLALDYEYDLDTKLSDVSAMALIGFDVQGILSLVIGPKINFTRNSSNALATFHIGLDITPQILFNSK